MPGRVPHACGRASALATHGAARLVPSLLLVLLAGAACSQPAGEPTAHGSPTPLDPASYGTVRGTVSFAGTAPPPVAAALASDPTCAALHPDGLTTRPVVVTADGRLADAFVWIARGLESHVFPVPEEPVVIEQEGCLFVPRVAGVRAGQALVFRSSDDTLHNVRGAPTRAPGWNVGMARPGAERRMVLTAPEVMIPIHCDVHPWMTAFVGVLAHPYFAVTGTDGRFTLADLPAGRYELAAWHPVLGRRTRALTVAAGETIDADLRFPSELDSVDPAP